jgi:hypothetical protein
MGNAISLSSLLASALASQTIPVEVGIATLKKSNDVVKQEGEALVQMLEDSMRLLDVYA